MNLSPVYCPSILSVSKTYQIDGILYRYLFPCSRSSINHPHYWFKPLSGQSKKADLKLNRNKLRARVYEVEGMSIQSEVVNSNAVQLTLL